MPVLKVGVLSLFTKRKRFKKTQGKWSSNGIKKHKYLGIKSNQICALLLFQNKVSLPNKS